MFPPRESGQLAVGRREDDDVRIILEGEIAATKSPDGYGGARSRPWGCPELEALAEAIGSPLR